MTILYSIFEKRYNYIIKLDWWNQKCKSPIFSSLFSFKNFSILYRFSSFRATYFCTIWLEKSGWHPVNRVEISWFFNTIFFWLSSNFKGVRTTVIFLDYIRLPTIDKLTLIFQFKLFKQRRNKHLYIYWIEIRLKFDWNYS